MLYRRAGIFHTDYAADRALFPIPADRWTIGLLLLIAATAPLYMNSLYLSSYLLPWLVWTAATLGLNLILGWAGQFHLGYAAVMGIGAYAAVHAMRAGIPWEIAIVLAGLTAAIIGIGFAFAALRVKGLYLALSTLALQFVMDWTISHVPAISGGTQATLQAPDIRLLGIPVTSDAGLYYIALVWCLLVTSFMLNLKRTALGRALVAVREKDYAAAVIGVNSFYFKMIAFATSSFIGGVRCSNTRRPSRTCAIPSLTRSCGISAPMA
jgi:branched-chain amino acid transport system permease protein